MKFIISILFLFVCFSVSAEEPQISSVPESHINQLYEEKTIIEKQIFDLNNQLKKSGELQSELNSNIEKNLKLQQEIQKTTEKLLGMTRDKQEKLPSLKVHLLQATNSYIFALPIVTIFIVLGGTFLSLRTIRIKSKESLEALDNSNQNQLNISKINNESERLKSQESIISSSRQKWINTLRDELSSLMSHQTQYSASSAERQSQIFSKIWEEICKIDLLLNPKEELHKQLMKELNTGFSLCTETANQTKYREQRAVILKISQEILKQEWIRVKSFE